MENTEDQPRFQRSEPVAGATTMRGDWSRLSPVERRRFLANDRTDMAEERTALAALRTRMAQTRLGMAFARTGVAFAGLGLAFQRALAQYGRDWGYFDYLLIILGALFALEGFRWFLPGYRAGGAGLKRFLTSLEEETIWDFSFPPLHRDRAWRWSGLC